MKSLQIRQSEAKKRDETHKTLTTNQKILKLDIKLGNMIGAKKERSKLFELLRKELEPKKEVVSMAEEKKKNYQKSKKS